MEGNIDITKNISDFIKTSQKAPTEALSTDALRSPFKKLIADVTEATQSPQDYVTASMFAVASVALGYKISLKWKTYMNHPNINMIFVGKSTAGKSQPLKLFIRPLEEAQLKEHIAYKEWYKQYKDNGEKGEKRTKKKYYISDFTPEALQRDEVQNPNGLLAYDDEISGLFSTLKGRYIKSSSFQPLIKMFDCDAIEVSRRGDDVGLFADHSFLSMVGTTQPGLLPGMISKELLSSGFAARFLFVYPEITHKIARAEAPQIDMSVWSQTIAAYLRLPPTELQMSADAVALYIDFQQELINKAEIEPDSLLAPIFGKIQIHVLHWAMISHYLCSPSMLPYDNIISGSEMSYSIDCMRYLLSHWLKTYLCIKGVAEPPKADQIIKMIYTMNPKAVQTEVANVLNKSQQYVSKVVKQMIR